MLLLLGLTLAAAPGSPIAETRQGSRTPRLQDHQAPPLQLAWLDESSPDDADGRRPPRGGTLAHFLDAVSHVSFQPLGLALDSRPSRTAIRLFRLAPKQGPPIVHLGV